MFLCVVSRNQPREIPRDLWGIRVDEIIQLAKIDNEDHLHSILHFSTNIICLSILSGSFFLGKEELVMLISWVQEFFYNLNDSIKAFFILLVTDFSVGNY